MAGRSGWNVAEVDFGSFFLVVFLALWSHMDATGRDVVFCFWLALWSCKPLVRFFFVVFGGFACGFA